MSQATNDNNTPAAPTILDAFILPAFKLASYQPGRTGMPAQQQALAFRVITCDDEAVFKEWCDLSKSIRAAQRELEAVSGEERNLIDTRPVAPISRGCAAPHRETDGSAWVANAPVAAQRPLK
jgi:hypothetical protein